MNENELERLQLRIATLEEENSRLHDTLEAILDYTPANIYWHGRDGTILGCNQRQAETLGYNCPEDIIGHHPSEFLNQKDSDYLMEIISQIVEQQKEQVLEEKITLVNGTRVMLSTYELFYYLPCYSQDTPICLDYQFECPVTGLDIAQSLHQAGYSRLYLATGFHMNPNNIPEYVQLIEDKMDITYL